MEKHKYGQHYTPKVLTDNYKSLFRELKNKDLTIVDPFVGEGNLLVDYLETFTKEEAIFLLNNKKIKGYDIDKMTITRLKERFHNLYGVSFEVLDEIFVKNNSLINNPCKKNDFILTNPPYMARNTCKRRYPKEYKVHFSRNYFSDYYELSLYKYRRYDGIWIIPSNFLSSEYMTDIKSKLLLDSNFEEVFVFENPIFKDTNISVMSFKLRKKDKHEDIQNKLKINFVGHNETTIKDIDISKEGKICQDWVELSHSKEPPVSVGVLRTEFEYGDNEIIVLNEDYEPENISVSDSFKEYLDSNILYLRSTDTGADTGFLGLYSFEDLYPDYKNHNVYTLITKKTSRLNVPLFFKEHYTKEEQELIKERTNEILSFYRDKYNSMFLTNFKNSTRKMQRKRIAFREIYGVIEQAIKDIKKQN